MMFSYDVFSSSTTATVLTGFVPGVGGGGGGGGGGGVIITVLPEPPPPQLTSKAQNTANNRTFATDTFFKRHPRVHSTCCGCESKITCCPAAQQLCLYTRKTCSGSAP